jgi:hypothetical protein
MRRRSEPAPAADVLADEWGDELVDELCEQRLEASTFVRAYEFFTHRRVLTLRETASGLGLSLVMTRRYLKLLSRHEDVYPSALREEGETQLYYCFAPRTLAVLCRRRKISLARFLKLSPILDKFMAAATEYYTHRLMEDHAGRTKISELKRKFAAKLQPIVSPATPLKTWPHPVTTHPAWRYVRTAQDLVLLRMDIPRPFLDAVNGHDPDEAGGMVRLAPGSHFLKPVKVEFKPTADGKMECQVRGCYKKLSSPRTAEHERAHVRRESVRAPKEGKEVIRCADCGVERVVNRQDLFQVKRCVACQTARRRERARKARVDRVQLVSASPSSSGGKDKMQEVNTIAEEKKAKAKAKAVKAEKPTMVTIKCVGFVGDDGKTHHGEGCSGTREIHVQDQFQVKRSTACQKGHRLQQAKARRASKRKAAPKKEKAPKPAKAPKAKAKPSKAKDAAPAAQETPAPEPTPTPSG